VDKEEAMRIQPGLLLAATLAMLTGRSDRLAAEVADSVRLCLAPATVEASNNAAAAVDAMRESFTGFLTGPSIKPEPLKARLESQAREEAKQASCPFILLTTLKLVSKRSGGGMLGQIAAGAARQGAWEAGATSGSAAGRIAGSAAYGGLSQAAYNYAATIRTKDELTLGYRLEAADGTVLVEQREKKKAKSDGEDLLTPLVQQAAERIVAAAKR
jgi:hypothetical protein